MDQMDRIPLLKSGRTPPQIRVGFFFRPLHRIRPVTDGRNRRRTIRRNSRSRNRILPPEPEAAPAKKFRTESRSRPLQKRRSHQLQKESFFTIKSNPRHSFPKKMPRNEKKDSAHPVSSAEPAPCRPRGLSVPVFPGIRRK